MHEIEAKIHLTKKEFEQLKQRLSQKIQMTQKGEFKKKDTYFHSPVPHLTIRIRKVNKKNYFNIKYRSSKEGIEINKEWEWELKRSLFFKNLLKKAGLNPYAVKFKKTHLFAWKKINIELNWVKHLGYFLEVEKLVKTEKSTPKAIQELKDVFKDLGFDDRPFEKKPYLELLSENEN